MNIRIQDNIFVCGTPSNKGGFRCKSLIDVPLSRDAVSYLDHKPQGSTGRRTYVIENHSIDGNEYTLFAIYQGINPNDQQTNRGAFIGVGALIVGKADMASILRYSFIITEVHDHLTTLRSQNNAFTPGFTLDSYSYPQLGNIRRQSEETAARVLDRHLAEFIAVKSDLKKVKLELEQAKSELAKNKGISLNTYGIDARHNTNGNLPMRGNKNRNSTVNNYPSKTNIKKDNTIWRIPKILKIDDVLNLAIASGIVILLIGILISIKPDIIDATIIYEKFTADKNLEKDDDQSKIVNSVNIIDAKSQRLEVQQNKTEPHHPSTLDSTQHAGSQR